MTKRTKKSALVALLLAFGGNFSSSAQAEVTAHAGKIINIFADPDDFVVELDTKGRCGAQYFHIRRANTNFKELTAVALTAFAANKVMHFFVVECVSDRNIVSHGFASQ